MNSILIHSIHINSDAMQSCHHTKIATLNFALIASPKSFTSLQHNYVSNLAFET